MDIFKMTPNLAKSMAAILENHRKKLSFFSQNTNLGPWESQNSQK